MAKKKATQNQDQALDQSAAGAAMVEASEKLQNLKSLNSMLLKEAVERRQQVDSLVRSKGSLESALTRSESENQALQAELTRLGDRTAQLDLERQLVFVVVSVQFRQQAEVVEKEREGFWREKVEVEERLGSLEREMREVVREKCEIERARREREAEIDLLKEKLGELVVEIEKERDRSIRVCRERDALRGELDVQIKEANGLRLKLVEAEKRERKIGLEVQKLKVEYNGVVEEKEERERRIESMVRDKDSIERSLAESNRVIEGLKREIEEVVREKEGIEEERNLEVMKKNELEISVTELNEMVMSLQVEEQRLRLNTDDLEKRCVEGVQKEKQMAMEIAELLRERKEGDRSFESLVEEKGLVKRELDEALKELDEQKRKMEEIVRKKIEVEAVKVKRESEIVEMQREVSELRVAISALEASCKDQTEKNGQLQSEVRQYRDGINHVTIERDEARKGLNEEKKNGIVLREKILEMEKKIEETQKVVDELKAENRNVIEEKKEIESRCTELMKEVASLENNLLNARKEVDDMKDKVELDNANSDIVLKMLRNTAAAMVCASKDEGDVKENDGFMDENKVGESVKPYVVELESIKNAFKKREVKAEDMKRQLEFLENSVVEAHKGKSFWTLATSATTILAAASVAYVARMR